MYQIKPSMEMSIFHIVGRFEISQISEMHAVTLRVRNTVHPDSEITLISILKYR